MRSSTAELLGLIDRYLSGLASADELYASAAALDAAQPEDADDWEEAVSDVWHALQASYVEVRDDVALADRLRTIRNSRLGGIAVHAGIHPATPVTHGHALGSVRVVTAFGAAAPSADPFSPEIRFPLRGGVPAG